MRPVLFLDIDGVLNSTDAGWSLDKSERSIDPIAVECLNRVVDQSGCLVVLSSSWRDHHPLSTVTSILRRCGFRHYLFGTTPTIWHDRPRSNEIDWWLKQVGEPVTFAIVDDDPDVGRHASRFVKVDSRIGITDEDVQRLVSLLKE